MTVVLTGYLKSHPAMKQEAQPQKVEQSAFILAKKPSCDETGSSTTKG
jgi:hypothetical protein